MNIKFILLFVISILLYASCVNNNLVNTEKSLSYCDRQVRRTLCEIGLADSVPRNIMDTLSEWKMVPVRCEEWTAGFWPGILWYDYEYTKDDSIRFAAEHYTDMLEKVIDSSVYDHDLGFLMFCSFGNAYRLTNREKYRQIVLRSADSLATLYNPVVGTILSWPREVKPRNWPHNTIMDNMINLEMLFWAAKNGGDKDYYNIAVAHADKTMKCHFRPDYTSYHVAVYDTITGNLIKGVTHQGYADNSMWARGQAWAIYGFTMCYRETQDLKYLDFVQKITDVYLKRLPEDRIPYWDFDAPGIPNEPRDASAAAIVASALLELSEYVPDEKRAGYYKSEAESMLASLASVNYCSGDSKPSFLLHSTGHMPNKSEVDASIIYADYYYIEALMRLKKLQEVKS